jgi:hypothetical protein
MIFGISRLIPEVSSFLMKSVLGACIAMSELSSVTERKSIFVPKETIVFVPLRVIGDILSTEPASATMSLTVSHGEPGIIFSDY